MAPTNTTPSEQSTQSFIDTGTANANPTWREAALAATMRLAARRERFTSHDVLQELANTNVKTHDLRAIGGVMQEARNLGLIASAGLVRRNDAHSRGATTLWESRLCQPTSATNPNSHGSGELHRVS
jgi:hypothetical protein